MFSGQQIPECPQVREGRCPKSDVRLMAEHGTAQATAYVSFCCRTCKYLFIEWNPLYVQAAKKRQLDQEVGNLVNPRFHGLTAKE